MYFMGIESSCDETSCAIVKADEQGKLELLSNVTVSQIDIHKLYGGVVPEIAGRAHIEAVSGITYEALEQAGITLNELTAIGVTYNPGLIGSLLVGVNFAKTLAWANGIPLVPVNHIKGHVAANYLSQNPPVPPFTALVASGGHTSLINVKSYTEYETIGITRDDAIGEAFDKVARIMDIPYPGGATIDKLAYSGDENAIKLPSAAIADDTLDFSFSGLKTAVVNYVHNMEQKGEEFSKEDVSASFTKAAVNSVIKKLKTAAERYDSKKLAVAGGVAANTHLRGALGALCARNKLTLYMPERGLCGDNGAMIAAQCYYEYMAGNFAGTDLNAIPS